MTGASRGIGLATAGALADAGASVALLARGAPQLEQAVDGIRRVGGHAVAMAADVADPADVGGAVAEAIRYFGDAPDLLVNNAGLFVLAPLHETDPEDFAAVVQTNLVGPFAVVRAVLPGMRARGTGHVVTIGSIADRHVFPENGAYAAAKFGARAMHEVLRAELRGSGVRASLVAPGPTDTSLWDPIEPDERPGFTPRAEMLRAQAVADAVVWVATRPAEVNVDELRLSRS
ncbi:MAG TPA: SDR family oxidoreductase [Gemmatimonadaceae bacterium]|nr:SDR family oxidoreductase [Gemmatimonadaceae bacterium]